MENWTPSYGKKQYKKKNRYEQEDGDVVFRILPQPKGNDAERSGYWSKYLSLHFGYKNTAGKIRPFESCLVKKNKEIVVADPALDRLNDLKAKLEKAKADNNEPLTAKLNALVGFMGVYNIDNNHYMNVIGLDGNIGLLKLRYTAKQALDEEIKRLQAAGVEPLSFDNGRFFVFSRSGKNRDTAFKVTVYSEQVDALTSRQVVHKVTPEILTRLETEGFNLNDIAAKLTPEEISQIVEESDLLTGKSPAVDRLIDARWKAKNANQSGNNRNVESDVDMVPAKGVVVKPLVAATTAVPHTSVAPTTAALAPISSSKPLDEMSDDEFRKMCELPN